MRKNSALLRLMSCIGDPSQCWVLPSQANPMRYATVRINGRATTAHRAMYQILVGPIPDGLQLDHLCRNRSCFNPKHLEPVTCQENLLRGHTHAAANSKKTHCRRGHAYDATNTILIATGRACRECGRIRAKEYARRQAQEFGVFRSTLNRRKKKPTAAQRVAKKRRTFVGAI